MRAAAWSLPVIVLSTAAPAMAASIGTRTMGFGALSYEVGSNSTVLVSGTVFEETANGTQPLVGAGVNLIVTGPGLRLGASGGDTEAIVTTDANGGFSITVRAAEGASNGTLTAQLAGGAAQTIADIVVVGRTLALTNLALTAGPGNVRQIALEVALTGLGSVSGAQVAITLPGGGGFGTLGVGFVSGGAGWTLARTPSTLTLTQTAAPWAAPSLRSPVVTAPVTTGTGSAVTAVLSLTPSGGATLGQTTLSASLAS